MAPDSASDWWNVAVGAIAAALTFFAIARALWESREASRRADAAERRATAAEQREITRDAKVDSDRAAERAEREAERAERTRSQQEAEFRELRALAQVQAEKIVVTATDAYTEDGFSNIDLAIKNGSDKPIYDVDVFARPPAHLVSLFEGRQANSFTPAPIDRVDGGLTRTYRRENARLNGEPLRIETHFTDTGGHRWCLTGFGALLLTRRSVTRTLRSESSMYLEPTWRNRVDAEHGGPVEVSWNVPGTTAPGAG